MNVQTDIFVINKQAFDKIVKYIKRPETVAPSECDRCHNQKPNTKGILPVAKLCNSCKREIGL